MNFDEGDEKFDSLDLLENFPLIWKSDSETSPTDSIDCTFSSSPPLSPPTSFSSSPPAPPILEAQPSQFFQAFQFFQNPTKLSTSPPPFSSTTSTSPSSSSHNTIVTSPPPSLASVPSPSIPPAQVHIPQPQPTHLSPTVAPLGSVHTVPTLPVAGYPPTIAFPFVPFWTGCPLPFDPRCYPQPVIPPPPPPPTTTLIPSESKEDKIAKYRNKRSKRNFNRQADQQRSLLAQSRPRDEKGKFEGISLGKKVERSLRAQVDELKSRLALSESESKSLRDKLIYMEEEVRLLKRVLRENDQNPSTPEDFSDEQMEFNSPKGTRMRDCYSEKIDFSKIELRKTDSPLLREETNKTLMDGSSPSRSITL